MLLISRFPGEAPSESLKGKTRLNLGDQGVKPLCSHMRRLRQDRNHDLQGPSGELEAEQGSASGPGLHIGGLHKPKKPSDWEGCDNITTNVTVG